MVHTFSRPYGLKNKLNVKKRMKCCTCDHIDEPGGHCTKKNKPVTKHKHYMTYMTYLDLLNPNRMVVFQGLEEKANE